MSIQDKQRTNATRPLGGKWMRCQSVTLQDGTLQCLLDQQRTYDLAKAYKSDPHAKFANADSDKKLADFIRDWGPLSIPHSLPDGRMPSDISLSLGTCRWFQSKISAALKALNALRDGSGEREALETLITVADMPSRATDLDWAKHARLAEVRARVFNLTKYILGAEPRCTLKLIPGKGVRVEADWKLNSLWDALTWMVWYDVFTQHPVVCCAECRQVFRGKTTRARKYCSEKCGHKATARKAMKDLRVRERAEKERSGRE